MTSEYSFLHCMLVYPSPKLREHHGRKGKNIVRLENGERGYEILYSIYALVIAFMNRKQLCLTTGDMTNNKKKTCN